MMEFVVLLLLGLVFGIGFGFFVQRSGLCFAYGLGEIFVGRGKRIIRMFIVIFVITSIGFLVSGYINPGLGLKAVGQIRGYGFFNILAGILFGAGIFLNGGCILGTLRQIGEGKMDYLIAMISFIPGMALVVYLIDPLLQGAYNPQTILLTDIFLVPAFFIILVLAGLSAIWFFSLGPKKTALQPNPAKAQVSKRPASKTKDGRKIL